MKAKAYEYAVRIANIQERLNKYLTFDWGEVFGAYNTVVRKTPDGFENIKEAPLSDDLLRFADKLAQSDIALPGPYLSCQYMGQRVCLQEDGSLHDEDVRCFADLTNQVVKLGLVHKAALGPCMLIPLAPIPKRAPRAMILLYMFSGYSRLELNDILQSECFIAEGSIPNDDWSKKWKESVKAN